MRVRDDEAIEEAVAFLRPKIGSDARLLLILGSGLGRAVDAIEGAIQIPYSEIPGFPRSTVRGHAGTLVAGRMQGVQVVAMAGRFHLYEGWDPAAVVRPLRILARLGVRDLVVTNAAGGLRTGVRPGELMLIADHLNLMFRNPLLGRVRAGEDRFPDMSNPYDRDLRALALRTANELGIPLFSGIYAGVLGPSFETPAEIRMLARLGADAVGMSTVPEVITASSLGMRTVGFSCITNAAAGLGPGKLSHDEVLEVGAAASESLIGVLRALVPRIAGV